MNQPQLDQTTPFISICVTTFDREELLKQTLASIFAQTYGDFEVLVGNNNPEHPLSSAMLGIDDPRLHIINRPQDLGHLGNVNALLDEARGRYVTFIADDDLYVPEFLGTVHAALEKYDFPACAFTAYELFYGLGQPELLAEPAEAVLYSGAEFLRNYLLERIQAIGIMGVFDASYLRATGKIEDVSEDGEGLYEEYMLLIRAGLLDRVVHIPAPLMYFRIHETAWGVASTDLDCYARAGENLLRKSAAILAGAYRGDLDEALFLIFNLALKQLLNKTGQQAVRVDVAEMLAKMRDVPGLAADAGNRPAALDIAVLLWQQFADAETGRMGKEKELWLAKKKDDEIRGLKADCNTKDDEIRTKDDEICALKHVCEEREKVIFELDARRKLLERTNILGKALLLVRSVLLLLWLPIRHRVLALVAPKLGVLRQYPPRPLQVSSPPVEMPPAGRLPRISIVTPSYNQAEYLGRTLDSVLGQGYPNLEYIVQDGASTDASAEILQKYADRLAYWQSAPDGGQTNAINSGFKHATGEIMAWLNSDDMLLPGVLAYVAAYFDAHPEVDVIYGHRVIIDEQDREIGRWVMPPHDGRVLSWADFVPQETLFWRRRAWDKVGGLDESFHFAMDWDFLLRLRDSGAVFARVPYFLGAFRVHPQQKTTAEISDTGFKEMARLRERCHGRQVGDGEIVRAVAPYLMKHVLYDKRLRYLSR